MKKLDKGITLIALVITIIVLLILAGVVLANITGQDSIIKNAENAVGQYKNSVTNEQELLNSLEQLLISKINGEGETGPVDKKGLATENVTIKPDENSNVQIVIPTGFAPAILATGTTQSLPGQDGSVASIMPYEEWNNITVEDINKGIVIVDNTITYIDGVPDFNEYVWVSIPESSNFARTAWTTPYGYNDSGILEYEEITHIIEGTSTEYYFWDNQTTTEYTNMVESIEQYKGFYIGRYEASDNGSGIAQSKRGVSAWINDVKQTTAITACTNNTTTENMHLIYGVEWDSTLNWLNNNATISSSTTGETKTIDIDDIQTNSASWGNYSNSTGDAATNSGSEQNTGASEYWKANNIYDLAGNVWERTQEKYSYSTYSAHRGGYFMDSGNSSTVAIRDYYDENSSFGGLRIP